LEILQFEAQHHGQDPSPGSRFYRPVQYRSTARLVPPTLSAENKSASTLLTYGKAVEQFAEFVARDGMPADVGALTREHVESFLIGLQGNGWKPASVANRFRSLQQFFKWLASEDPPAADASPTRLSSTSEVQA
jgi:site-specific recombinase XerD